MTSTARRRGAAALLAAAALWLAECRTGALAAPAPIRISLIGTNDLHGHLTPSHGEGGVEIFAGYLTNLRAARSRDGGGVLLVDAGDMLQGTLESNTGEGAVVVALMNALGYAAAAIGNHEFDFGPRGPAATPRSPADDPRGALEDRAREARFPLLSANLVEEATGRPPRWPNVRASALVSVAGLRVGLVGVTTEETPTVTMPLNFRGLAVTPLAAAIAREAKGLREQGAEIVIALAHAGTKCKVFDDPRDSASCDAAGEIVRVASELPPGTVDAIVAGHSHSGVAHWIHGIPVIESYAYGRDFGRIDFVFDRSTHALTDRRIFPPHPICARVVAGSERCNDEAVAPGSSWEGARYEGSPVRPDAKIARLVAPSLEAARETRRRPLGITMVAAFGRRSEGESPLGNLFTELLLEAVPGADAAMLNGGGLREDLPAGALTYGALYDAYPFDNRRVTLRISGGDLSRVLAANLGRTSGFLSIAGLRARAACDGAELHVALTRSDGRPVADNETLRLVTTDFLVAGGDQSLAAAATAPGVLETSVEPLRDALAARLTKRGGTLDPNAFFDPRQPRVSYEGKRPVRCPAG